MQAELCDIRHPGKCAKKGSYPETERLSKPFHSALHCTWLAYVELNASSIANAMSSGRQGTFGCPCYGYRRTDRVTDSPILTVATTIFRDTAASGREGRLTGAITRTIKPRVAVLW